MSSSINLLPLELDLQDFQAVDLNPTNVDIADVPLDLEPSISFKALDFTELAKKVCSATVKVRGVIEEKTIYDANSSSWQSAPVHGSGFFISQAGYLVTNYHVIQGLKKIEVVFAETSKTFQATCVGSDPELDVAVLKINSEESLPYLLFAQSCTVGQKAMLAGNPSIYSNIITTGYIASESYSACSNYTHPLNVVGSLNEYILYDGTTYGGNSGGALVDEYGNILGILSRGSTEFPLGYAGSGPHVKKAVQEILEKGFVSRAGLGFKTRNLMPPLCKAYNLSSGVFVRDINPESTAYQAGLRFGDVITTCDEKPILDVGTWMQDLALRYSPHHVVHLQVLRGKETLDIFLELGERKLNTPTQVDALGASFIDIESEVEMSLGYESTKKGALIWTINPKSPLGSLGLNPGDLITGFVLENGTEIPCNNVQELLELYKKVQEEKSYWIKCSSPDLNTPCYCFVAK